MQADVMLFREETSGNHRFNHRPISDYHVAVFFERPLPREKWVRYADSGNRRRKFAKVVFVRGCTVKEVVDRTLALLRAVYRHRFIRPRWTTMQFGSRVMGRPRYKVRS